MKVLLPIVLLSVLTGCASSGRYDIKMSTSELSQAIESTTSSVVNVDADHGGFFGHMDISAVYFGDFYDDDYGDDYDGGGGFANNRVGIAKRATLNVGVNQYNVNGGYEISFTGGDDVHQFRVALHGNGADFQSSGTNGFNSPMVFGVDFDVHKIFQQADIDFLIGARMSSAILGYGFDTPVVIHGSRYESDGLGMLGFGLPVGLQMDVGLFSLEAIAAPTFYIHGYETELGFINDLANFNVNVPISVGLGLNW